jgi:hypothetical protein
MSFVGRFNKFVCDKCGYTAFVKAYPDGWIYIPTPPMGVNHHCDGCERKRKKKNEAGNDNQGSGVDSDRLHPENAG